MFDTPGKLLLGLVTGFAFGFLLQKGRVAKYEVILGQLLMRDWTVAKIMLTAIAVGAVGVYGMHALGWVGLHVKPLQLGGIVVGALLFGIGMAVLGYCPGTSVAACGEGRRDAIVGAAGMLTGALVYVLAYPVLRPLIQAGNYGALTVQQATGTSPWFWVAALLVIVLGVWTSIGRRWDWREKPPAARAHPAS